MHSWTKCKNVSFVSPFDVNEIAHWRRSHWNNWTAKFQFVFLLLRSVGIFSLHLKFHQKNAVDAHENKSQSQTHLFLVFVRFVFLFVSFLSQFIRFVYFDLNSFFGCSTSVEIKRSPFISWKMHRNKFNCLWIITQQICFSSEFLSFLLASLCMRTMKGNEPIIQTKSFTKSFQN